MNPLYAISSASLCRSDLQRKRRVEQPFECGLSPVIPCYTSPIWPLQHNHTAKPAQRAMPPPTPLSISFGRPDEQQARDSHPLEPDRRPLLRLVLAVRRLRTHAPSTPAFSLRLTLSLSPILYNPTGSPTHSTQWRTATTQQLLMAAMARPQRCARRSRMALRPPRRLGLRSCWTSVKCTQSTGATARRSGSQSRP